MVVHTPFDLIDEASRYGYEVLSITNHNLQLFRDEITSYAADRGILLIPGVEATLEGKHVLLYNFSDYHPGWTSFDHLEKSKGKDQLVIAPHPFYPIGTALGRLFYERLSFFDALEYSSLAMNLINFNTKARRVAEEHKLPLVANSDLHFLFQLGRSYSMIYAEKTTTAVISAIKEGRVRPSAKVTGLTGLLNWFASSYVNRLRYALGHAV
jgi:predicted metal-dependent phosphoesterase TrpH